MNRDRKNTTPQNLLPREVTNHAIYTVLNWYYECKIMNFLNNQVEAQDYQLIHEHYISEKLRVTSSR